MNNLILFLMCFLVFWSILVIVVAFFGFKHFNKKRNDSIKQFKKKHRIDL